MPIDDGSRPACLAPACTAATAARRLAAARPTRRYTPSATRPAIRSVFGPPAAIQTGTGRACSSRTGLAASEVDRLARQQASGQRGVPLQAADRRGPLARPADRRVADAEDEVGPASRELVNGGDSTRPGWPGAA